MSNVSSGSSSRSRFVTGIPKRCWCGSTVRSIMSNSGRNPHRRYFRCTYAVAEKLVDDDHVFKWMDEAIVNEIERIDRQLVDMERKSMEHQQRLVEQLQMMVEKEIVERSEYVLAESECKMKKLVACAMVVGCMITVGVMKIIG